MSRKPITIAGTTFATKDGLRKHIRGIVDHYRDDEPIGPDDLAFMTALLERHRWRDEKIGSGIAGMTVRVNAPFPQRGFWITRVDGTRTDFSWVECVDASSKRKDVLDAMRAAIADQKAAFREAFFSAPGLATCPLTGEPITRDDCHVDHEAPDTFESLAGRFIAENAVNIEGVNIDGYGDGELFKSFRDDDLRIAWQEFHRAHARLRLLSKRGNLSLARRAAP